MNRTPRIGLPRTTSAQPVSSVGSYGRIGEPALDVAGDGPIRALKVSGVGVTFAHHFVEGFVDAGRFVARNPDPVTAAANRDLAIIHCSQPGFNLNDICAAGRRVVDGRGVTTTGQEERL